MDGWRQMGRAKIPIKWIPKDTSRNVTFVKRKKGLRKKVEELSILCGVEACMVCFGPQTDQQISNHPDVFPSMPKALEVIERYRRLSKEEQDKKKLDNSGFLEQRIKKLKLELHMKRKENNELEVDTMYPSWDNCLNYLSVERLKDLLGYIDKRLEAVNDRINFLTTQEREISDAADGNNIVPFTEMQCIARQPLMESYHSSNPHIMLHNIVMPMPYQNQESLSLAMCHAYPYLSQEGQGHRSFYEATPMEYLSKASPIVFTALTDPNQSADSWAAGNNNNIDKDHVVIAATEYRQHNKASLDNGHLVTRKNFTFYDHHVQPNANMALGPNCCTIYSPCPQHYSMDSHGFQTAPIQEFQVSCDPQQHQQFLGNLIETQNIHHNLVGDEGISFADNSLGASSRIDEGSKREYGSG